MFQLAHNVVKAKHGFFNIKPRNNETDDYQYDEDQNNPRTFEKLAKDEKNNKNITEDKYFFNKLNDIFQKFLGPTIRRQYNYFLCEKFIEESIMKSLDSIDQDELADYAIKILRKDSDKRFFEEILILQKVTENVEAFKHIRAIKGKEVLFNCLKNLKYKYGKMGSFLQRQDEPVRSLFIVIKGLIQVKTITNKESNTPRRNMVVGGFSAQQSSAQNKDNQIKTTNFQQKQKLPQRRQSKLQKKFSFQESLEELNSQNKLKFLYLNRGQSYGDKYILAQDDALAENQAYLFDNCHLAYLDIIKFKTILDERVLQKLQREIAEFSEMNVINQLEQKFVAALYVRTKTINLKRKNVLTIENENAEFVYFIKEGEVKLTKKLIYDNTKNNKIEEKKESQKNQNVIAGTYQIPHQTVQNFELAILVKGQFIGLEEFLKDQPYQSSSFIYSTEATLYQIHRYEFLQLLSINKPVRDQITEYFEKQQEVDHRQERVSNYNQYTGKIDTKTKQLEEQLEKLQSKKSDEEIKKKLQEGQDMIIKSNIALNIKPQTLNTNLEFIKQSIQQKDAKIQFKKKKKQEIYTGCQFSEEQLENMQKNILSSTRTFNKFPVQTIDSPLKLNSTSNKFELYSKSTANLMQTLHAPLYSPNKQNSLHKLEKKSTLLEISSTNLNSIKDKYPSTFTNIDNDQDNTDHLKQNITLTERDSLQFISIKTLNKNNQNNRKNKLKLDPIIISQSTQVSQTDEKKNFDEHLNNSMQQHEIRSPQSILEINSDGMFKKRLNVKLKLQAQTERKSLDYIHQDSSRQKSYFNEFNNHSTQNMNSVDAFQIKSFTQILNINQTNSISPENLNNQIYQDSTINGSQHNTKSILSRKNSQEILELYGSPPKTSKSKINFNRIHSRLELASTSNLSEKEIIPAKRSHSTKNQLLPLKYRVKDIVESKDNYQTMYKDNIKRTKLYQQTKNFFKVQQNPYIDNHTIFNH
ncbi:cyclic nucleotide-binding domain protein (macronuclear) [Tetrahymena thermophila SB210]|uniref:Cyclic nucleotide-binding domain protein n=1 Tax=Tetrahymena thermophila (strain SB210) TaxID=312017 RepID=Q24I87_TETTS|nr:cyclic nucleotide-binding domain protein [Tetrahymena thermophila SB210]EAS07510.2 cyclic nucleotide-binding domain protein [Tetrahymena thermophila SB210]|eukprot:XP_001027752.2 cyclic nucleotide-binding domain protein [Tetrahymena thermophila SB210]